MFDPPKTRLVLVFTGGHLLPIESSRTVRRTRLKNSKSERGWPAQPTTAVVATADKPPDRLRFEHQ